MLSNNIFSRTVSLKEMLPFTMFTIQRYTNDMRDIRIRCTNLVKHYRIYIKARVKGATLKLKVEWRRSLAEGETTQQVLLESTEESLFRYGEHVSSSRLSLFNLSGFQVKLREQTITLPQHANKVASF